MLSIRNVTYTKCYLYKVYYTKCYLDEMLLYENVLYEMLLIRESGIAIFTRRVPSISFTDPLNIIYLAGGHNPGVLQQSANQILCPSNSGVSHQNKMEGNWQLRFLMLFLQYYSLNNSLNVSFF